MGKGVNVAVFFDGVLSPQHTIKTQGMIDRLLVAALKKYCENWPATVPLAKFHWYDPFQSSLPYSR